MSDCYYECLVCNGYGIERGQGPFYMAEKSVCYVCNDKLEEYRKTKPVKSTGVPSEYEAAMNAVIYSVRNNINPGYWFYVFRCEDGGYYVDTECTVEHLLNGYNCIGIRNADEVFGYAVRDEEVRQICLGDVEEIK